MKKELNAAVKSSSSKIGEVFLFQAMANEFNHNPISKCTYVKEIHGAKGKVEFSSAYSTRGSERVELGDLLILTFDRWKKELRLCVLQAKYKSGRYYRFLGLNANLFQWELLYKKLPIINRGSFNFPSNILNFRTDYESITAYGIFYHDNISNEIDFLYTLPKFFRPLSLPRYRRSNGTKWFKFRCPYGLGSPNRGCIKGITPEEAISTCSIDTFEDQVLLCNVGAPIPRGSAIERWILALLNSMRIYADHPEVIDELFSAYNNNVPRDYTYSIEGAPSALVIITDSSKYRKIYKNRMEDDLMRWKDIFGN